MKCVIYVTPHSGASIYSQYNDCASHAGRKGYHVCGKVLDFERSQIHEAINKVIADETTTAMIVYSREAAFNDYEEYLFYRIYLEMLGKVLIVCN